MTYYCIVYFPPQPYLNTLRFMERKAICINEGVRLLGLHNVPDAIILLLIDFSAGRWISCNNPQQCDELNHRDAIECIVCSYKMKKCLGCEDI